jgi:hypothetical protein
MALLETGGSQDAITRTRARNTLIRTVRERLKGRGLDIREREHELVISSPGHPEKGSIHITLPTGEVSHRRTLWDYLGVLPGYAPEDPDEPAVSVDKIASTLTGPDHPGTPLPPGPPSDP